MKRCVRTYYRLLWDTSCVKLWMHNLCITFQRWTEDQTLCTFFSSIPLYARVGNLQLFAHIHKSRTVLVCNFVLWLWSVWICPRLTVLTHTHTHTHTNSCIVGVLLCSLLYWNTPTRLLLFKHSYMYMVAFASTPPPKKKKSHTCTTTKTHFECKSSDLYFIYSDMQYILPLGVPQKTMFRWRYC